MFNLEHSIAEWRQQMLAAGIVSPVPLEELESHLREEIEEQIKLGLTAAAAFQVSISKVGQGYVLQNEFNKVDTKRKTRPASILALGWLAAIVLLLYGTGWFDYFDFFSYRTIPGGDFHYVPKPFLEKTAIFFGIIIVEVGIWFLAKASCQRKNRVVALMACLCPIWVAYFQLSSGLEEPILRRMRDLMEPYRYWYQGGQILLFTMPIIFLIWWNLQYAVRKQISKKETRQLA